MFAETTCVDADDRRRIVLRASQFVDGAPKDPELILRA
jgi:hypothetical protein